MLRLQHDRMLLLDILSWHCIVLICINFNEKKSIFFGGELSVAQIKHWVTCSLNSGVEVSFFDHFCFKLNDLYKV